MHGHLEAASGVAAGLCGDHADELPGAADADPCGLCLAAGQGRAAPARVVAHTRLATRPRVSAPAREALRPAAPAPRAHAPRAPPSLV